MLGQQCPRPGPLGICSRTGGRGQQPFPASQWSRLTSLWGLRGAQSSGLGEAHTLTLRRGSTLLFSEPAPCSACSSRLSSSKPSPGSALGAQSLAECRDISTGGSPAHPAHFPPWDLETGSDTFKVTRPMIGRTRIGARGSCGLVDPPPSHSQACGAHRRSGGAPSGRSPDSGSVAGCAGPAPPGTGNEAPCPPHSAAAGGQTLEPGAVPVGTHRILKGGTESENGSPALWVTVSELG